MAAYTWSVIYSGTHGALGGGRVPNATTQLIL